MKSNSSISINLSFNWWSRGPYWFRKNIPSHAFNLSRNTGFACLSSAGELRLAELAKFDELSHRSATISERTWLQANMWNAFRQNCAFGSHLGRHFWLKINLSRYLFWEQMPACFLHGFGRLWDLILNFFWHVKGCLKRKGWKHETPMFFLNTNLCFQGFRPSKK